ncbi:MAG: ABC transporter permease subunit [Halobacteriaceae archaeon]
MVTAGYLGKRLLQAGITIWGAITLSFVIVHKMPGSPAAYMAARLAGVSQLSQTQINRIVQTYLQLKPDAPLHEQYLNYLSSVVLHFDFGRSVTFNRPVSDIILDALPWTIFISLVAISIGTIMFLLIGSFLATKEGSKWDVFGSYFVMFSDSVPYYVVALLLLFVFGFVLGWFPTRGQMQPGTTPGFNLPFMKGVLYYASLPILSFAVTAWGGLSFRAHCTRILGEDYIRVGRLRGLRESRIMVRYVAWNSLLPMYTGIMAGMAAVFGGSIIMENIFTYPGMGYYMWKAIQTRDYPLMLGGLIIFTVVTVIALLIADLTYGWIDPRVSNRESASYGTNLARLAQGAVRKVRRLVRGSDADSMRLDPVDLSGFDRVEGAAVGGTAASNGGRPVSNGDSAGAPGTATAPEGLRERLEVAYESLDRRYLQPGYRTLDRRVLTPMRILWSAPRARVGLLIVLFYVFLGFVAPEIVAKPSALQASPENFSMGPFQSLAHPLGTDKIGTDLVSRLVYSTTPMLKMMFAGALFASLVGAAVGIGSGYFGGTIDWLLTTLTDIMINIPGIPLLVVIAAIFEPSSPAIVGIILAIDDWPSLARQLRSEVLTIREKSYVEAARTMGLSSSTIFSKKILMNLMPLITMNTMRAARNIVFVSAGLYFLGILPYNSLNWGVWMDNARDSGALTSPDRFYLIAIPLFAITTLSLGLLLFSQGTDRLYNPRIRARHAKTAGEKSESSEVVDSE